MVSVIIHIIPHIHSCSITALYFLGILMLFQYLMHHTEITATIKNSLVLFHWNCFCDSPGHYINFLVPTLPPPSLNHHPHIHPLYTYSITIVSVPPSQLSYIHHVTPLYPLPQTSTNDFIPSPNHHIHEYFPCHTIKLYPFTCTSTDASIPMVTPPYKLSIHWCHFHNCHVTDKPISSIYSGGIIGK